MAKNKKELDEEVQIVDVVVLSEETVNTALSSINPYREVIKQIATECATIEITDRTSLELATKAVGRLVKLRTGIDKRRLEMVRPMLEFQKKFKAECDSMISDIETIEEPIRNKINAEELRLQEEAKAEHLRRVTMIESAGWTLAGQFYQCGMSRILFDLVDQADEQQLQQWVEVGIAERERLAAIAAAEQARIDELEIKSQELARREAALSAKLARLEQLERLEQQRNSPPEDLFAEAGIPNLVVEQPEQIEPVHVPLAVNVHAPVHPLAGLATQHGVSVETLMASEIFKGSFNFAIDCVLEEFQNKSMSKEQWIVLFNSIRK